MSGLGKEHWNQVISVLRQIIPVYDKVNNAISLGNDKSFRVQAIRERILPGNKILDAGSGFGNMSRIVLQETKGDARIVLYDPIPEMLLEAKYSPYSNFFVALSSGVFEFIPFKSDIFDAVLCGYSLRDAIHLKQAVKEMHRVLKKGGKLIIVDIGKPDNRIIEAFASLYIKYILGIIAFVVAGTDGFKFKTIHGTYLRWPANSELYKILSETFSRIEFDQRMMGAAIIVAAYK